MKTTAKLSVTTVWCLMYLLSVISGKSLKSNSDTAEDGRFLGAIGLDPNYGNGGGFSSQQGYGSYQGEGRYGPCRGGQPCRNGYKKDSDQNEGRFLGAIGADPNYGNSGGYDQSGGGMWGNDYKKQLDRVAKSHLTNKKEVTGQHAGDSSVRQATAEDKFARFLGAIGLDPNYGNNGVGNYNGYRSNQNQGGGGGRYGRGRCRGGRPCDNGNDMRPGGKRFLGAIGADPNYGNSGGYDQSGGGMWGDEYKKQLGLSAKSHTTSNKKLHDGQRAVASRNVRSVSSSEASDLFSGTIYTDPNNSQYSVTHVNYYEPYQTQGYGSSQTQGYGTYQSQGYGTYQIPDYSSDQTQGFGSHQTQGFGSHQTHYYSSSQTQSGSGHHYGSSSGHAQSGGAMWGDNYKKKFKAASKSKTVVTKKLNDLLAVDSSVREATSEDKFARFLGAIGVDPNYGNNGGGTNNGYRSNQEQGERRYRSGGCRDGGPCRNGYKKEAGRENEDRFLGALGYGNARGYDPNGGAPWGNDHKKTLGGKAKGTRNIRRKRAVDSNAQGKAEEEFTRFLGAIGADPNYGYDNGGNSGGGLWGDSYKRGYNSKSSYKKNQSVPKEEKRFLGAIGADPNSDYGNGGDSGGGLWGDTYRRNSEKVDKKGDRVNKKFLGAIGADPNYGNGGNSGGGLWDDGYKRGYKDEGTYLSQSLNNHRFLGAIGADPNYGYDNGGSSGGGLWGDNYRRNYEKEDKKGDTVNKKFLGAIGADPNYGYDNGGSSGGELWGDNYKRMRVINQKNQLHRKKFKTDMKASLQKTVRNAQTSPSSEPSNVAKRGFATATGLSTLKNTHQRNMNNLKREFAPEKAGRRIADTASSGKDEQYRRMSTERNTGFGNKKDDRYSSKKSILKHEAHQRKRSSDPYNPWVDWDSAFPRMRKRNLFF